MMNVEVHVFSEEEMERQCWAYIAKNWDDVKLKAIRKHWQDFLRDTRAARRDGKAVPCPTCQTLVHPTAIWHYSSVCHFCDRYLQPYPANPRNRDLFNRFIAPELKRRNIVNPLV